MKVYIQRKATTNSDILSVGQPISWYIYVIKIATKFNLRAPDFKINLEGHVPRPPSFKNALHTTLFAKFTLRDMPPYP